MSSSEGSYAFFGSPSSSLEHLQANLSQEEFEFIGFTGNLDAESTCGISGLPFYTQRAIFHNNTMTEVNGGEFTATLREASTGEASEGWKRYERYATMRLNRINKELTSVRNQLADTGTNNTISMLKAYNLKTIRWRTELSRLDDDLKEVALTETATHDQIGKLDEDLADLSSDVDVVSSIVEQLLDTARENSSHQQSFVTALREVANSPTVELPTFYGETTKYASFKENFQFVIIQVNGPKELWATHLVNSLKGTVKQYIGADGNWFNKYDELWEMLDNKYANKWLLSTDTVSTFFHKALPTDEPDPVKNYFYEQLDNIASIIKLGMSSEELCVNHLIQTLPPAYRKELRDGLRILQPAKTKATFSTNEVRKVFNDTIGVIRDEAEAPFESTIGLQVATDYQPQETVNKAQNDVLPIQHYLSQQQTYLHDNHTHQQNFLHSSGQAQDQVGGFEQPKVPVCSICWNEDASPHPTHHCPHCPTPQEKRAALALTKRCPDCTRDEHPGVQCPGYLSCQFHPGERHYTWLCSEQPTRDNTA